MSLTWPEAFERYLLEEVLGAPVSAGRLRMARAADVALVWEKGRVRGVVELPSGRFLVTLRVRPLADRAWKWALGQLIERPQAVHALLAGRMEEAVVEAFEEGNASLFVPATRRVECSCKGDLDCRHRLALVAQMVAEAVESPFLWLTVLGRERETFLADLRLALAPEPEALAGSLDRNRYWRSAAVPLDEPIGSVEPLGPGLLVEQLGPVPQVDGPLLVAGRGGPAAPAYRSLTEFLQLYARQVAVGAKALQVEARFIPKPPPIPEPPARPTPRKRRSRRRYR